MMRIPLLLVLTQPLAPLAEACEGRAACKREHVAAPDARRASKSPAHIGEHCSYSTSEMIARVLDRGTPWAYTGPLVQVEGAGTEAFAVPYTTPDAAKLLANEVLDRLVIPTPQTPVTLTGRVLDHAGVHYVVVTAITPES